MALFRRKSCFTVIVLATLIIIITVVLKVLTPEDNALRSSLSLGRVPHLPKMDGEKSEAQGEAHTATGEGKVQRKGTAEENRKNPEIALRFPEPNYDVHAFYYTWYGSPEFDGKFIHWNHPFLPHWDPKVAVGYPTGRHVPPDDIGANFYPALGPYSSRDPSVIEAHMQQLRTATTGVLAVSWYPPGLSDDNGEQTDGFLPLIMDIAHKYLLKVAFHIEPYKGRDERNMFDNVKYITEKYGDHPAFFRFRTNNGKLLPLYYVYDSYLQTSDSWAELLKHEGKHSIRNTPYDGIFIGLLVEEQHKKDILAAGFDGVYTYFATNGFSYGSTHRNWRSIKAFCDEHDLMFIPSVGPGYIDTSIRPWNFQNTRNRINGKYYETSFRTALETKPQIISITSFNEWHEGTQIETAIPKSRGQTAYIDYLPHKPSMYLEITGRWAKKFSEEQEKWLELAK